MWRPISSLPFLRVRSCRDLRGGLGHKPASVLTPQRFDVACLPHKDIEPLYKVAEDSSSVCRVPRGRADRPRSAVGPDDPFGNIDIIVGAPCRAVHTDVHPVAFQRNSAGPRKVLPFVHVPLRFFVGFGGSIGVRADETVVGGALGQPAESGYACGAALRKAVGMAVLRGVLADCGAQTHGNGSFGRPAPCKTSETGRFAGPGDANA